MKPSILALLVALAGCIAGPAWSQSIRPNDYFVIQVAANMNDINPFPMDVPYLDKNHVQALAEFLKDIDAAERKGWVKLGPMIVATPEHPYFEQAMATPDWAKRPTGSFMDKLRDQTGSGAPDLPKD